MYLTLELTKSANLCSSLTFSSSHHHQACNIGKCFNAEVCYIDDDINCGVKLYATERCFKNIALCRNGMEEEVCNAAATDTN